jgi:hypothetical protein
MYTLFLDESGDNNLVNINQKMPHFILGGILIKEQNRPELQHASEFIKQKYYGDKYHVFHAADGTHLTGNNYTNFTNDVQKLIEVSELNILVTSVDKRKFLTRNPPIIHALSNYTTQKGYESIVVSGQRSINKKSAYEIFTMYLYFLRSLGEKGRVVIEADGGEKDRQIFEAYNQLLSSGHPTLGVSVTEVRQIISSIAFVTKNNFDIETQLADMLAYFSHQYIRTISGIKKKSKNEYQDSCMKIFLSRTIKYKTGSDPLEQEKESFTTLY